MSHPLLLLALLSLSALAAVAAGIGSHGHHARIGPHGHHASTGRQGHHARTGPQGHHARTGRRGHHAAGQGHHLRMKLHRRRPHPHVTKLEQVHDLVNDDRERHQAINSKLRPHAVNNASFAMVVNSGSYTNQGTYFVHLQVGTPAQKFVLVPDTGSEITWMRCKYEPNGPNWPGRRVFDAAASKSFKKIDCSSEICMTRLPNALNECPTPASPCKFNYQYTDSNSYANGIYANEWATVVAPNGGKTKLEGLVIGCATDFGGGSFDAADGILGLGFNDETFAVHASQVYGGRFSYCLVDHLSPKNVSSYLTFGPNPAFTAPIETPLIFDRTIIPFYGLAIEGISVGGEVLPIPASLWDVKKGGGTIMDSGTTITVLTSPAYELVTSAIHKHLVAVPRVPDDSLEYCYYWPGIKGPPPEVPQLVIHLAGGAELKPPLKSYLIQAAPAMKCIGFSKAPQPGLSIIGNIIQQEHLWEFDLKNQVLRFQPDTCEPNK